MKTTPTRISNSVVVTVIAGWRRLVPDGSCRSPLVDCAEDLVPDPV